MRIMFLLFAVLWNVSVMGQAVDTAFEYFIDGNKKKATVENGTFYRKVARKNNVWTVKDYFIEEKSLQMEGSYFDDSLTVKNGMFYWYHPNKRLQRKGRYINGKKEGMWKSYNEEGKLADSALYKNGIPYKFAYRFSDNGKVIMTGVYDENGAGGETAYYENGTIDYFGKLCSGYLKDSVWIFFFENGDISAKEYFDKGKLLKIECFTKNIKEKQSTIESGPLLKSVTKLFRDMDEDLAEFIIPDEMPEASYNVNKFLNENIRYPAEAHKKGAQGKVNVHFVVNEDGKISNLKIIGNRLGYGLDEEAMRVVSIMPKWKPGKVRHRPVKVHFTLPVNFRSG